MLTSVIPFPLRTEDREIDSISPNTISRYLLKAISARASTHHVIGVRWESCPSSVLSTPASERGPSVAVAAAHQPNVDGGEDDDENACHGSDAPSTHLSLSIGAADISSSHRQPEAFVGESCSVGMFPCSL